MYERTQKEEENTGMMETLDRIEVKLGKMRGGCEFLVSETKENHEHFLFREAYDLAQNQIDFNLEDIDDLRINYAHGVDISPGLKKLKWEFNYTVRCYKELCPLFMNPHRSQGAQRRRPFRLRPY